MMRWRATLRRVSFVLGASAPFVHWERVSGAQRLVHRRRDGNVLHRHASQVGHGDLLVRRARRRFARDDVPQLDEAVCAAFVRLARAS